MARTQTSFVCQSCGAVQPRWSGRCDACGEWNSFAEETAIAAVGTAAKAARKRGLELVPMVGEDKPVPRLKTGITEFDRALGGGLVQGSAILIGGDPGIGKSTLTLQAAAKIADQGFRVVYLSGEESISQIRLRAARLGLAKSPVELAATSSVGEVLASLDNPQAPAFLIIDSIQTMRAEEIESAAGTVTQLRSASQSLIRLAKQRGTAVLLIGHVTKDGQIAGPRVLEHMVDAVLYFEGERGHQFRLLRAVKNRFGPANEIGVFEMREEGLLPVANPSALFLGEHDRPVTGAAVFAGIEGTRPILVEIQALVAQSALGTPRRAVVGWDGNRLAMLLAVLEARCGLVMSGRDVYLNVAGGLRVNEPAADLAVAAALISSLQDRPSRMPTVVFGEVGLAGEVRSVAQTEQRLNEAAKLGFERVLMPKRSGKTVSTNLQTAALAELNELIELI